ncbi:hypothetical protein D3C87_1397380 [compost metagenome]
MSLSRFMRTRYVEGGRGPEAYDCWGIVRDAKVALFGGEPLPLCADALPGHIPAITREVGRVATELGMHEAQPAPGMIATAWHGRLCVHVGLVVIVDGMTWVLETDKPTGPCLTRLRQFEDRYSKVVYYAD